MSKKLEISIGLIIVLLFSLFGFYTISDYGLAKHSEDEYVRGEAYLNFFLTGHKDYLNIPDEERCFFQKTTLKEAIDTDFIALRYIKDLTGPIGGIISAFGCYIFYKKLGLLNFIDAHNAMFIILSALAIFIVYLFALEIYGVEVATLSAIYLALLPRFVGDAHFNYREIPIFCFGTLAIWTFWKGTRKQDWRWILLSSIFWGLCLSNKLTALYIPLLMVSWVGFLVWKYKKHFNRGYWITFWLYPFTAVSVLFLIWPYLWYNSLNHFKDVINLYIGVGLSSGAEFGSPGVVKWHPYYAPLYTLITTPVITMLLGMVGLFYAIKSLKTEEDKTSLLVIIWLLGPILSFTLPKVLMKSGIRYFMLFYSGLAILAGLGSKKIYDLIVDYLKRFKKNIVIGISLGIQSIFVFSLFFSVMEAHPYQYLYFNSLIGGFYGAKTIRIPFRQSKSGIPGAVDYWGNPYNSPTLVGIPDAFDNFFNSYRRAFKWINKHVEPNSYIFLWRDSMQKIKELPGLRKDLKPNELRWTRLKQVKEISQGNPCYILFVTDMALLTGWSDVVQYCFNNLKPIYSEGLQGAPVFLIYKLS